MFQASFESSHKEELWYNETVCLWMTIYIYIYMLEKRALFKSTTYIYISDLDDQVHKWVTIFTNLSARAGYDTKSILNVV